MVQHNLWTQTLIQLFHILIDIPSHHINQLNQIFTQYLNHTEPRPAILVHSITITIICRAMEIRTINLKYLRAHILEQPVRRMDHFKDFMEIPINWVDRTVTLIQCRDECKLLFDCFCSDAGLKIMYSQCQETFKNINCFKFYTVTSLSQFRNTQIPVKCHQQEIKLNVLDL